MLMQFLSFTMNGAKSGIIAPMQTVQIALQMSVLQEKTVERVGEDISKMSKRVQLVNQYSLNGLEKPFSPI